MRGATPNGSEILAERMKRGWTQDELAQRSKLDVKTLRKAEQGKRVDLATLTQLALAFGDNLSRFITAGSAEPGEQIGRRDVILQWYRAFESHDLEGVLALYTDDAVLHLPGGPTIPFGGVHRGREAIRRAHEGAWSMVRTEPLRLEELKILVVEDTATVEGTQGMHLPTGEIAWFLCIHVLAFQGNLFASHTVQYDTLEFTKRMQIPV